MRKSEERAEIDDGMAHVLFFREKVFLNVIEISYVNDKLKRPYKSNSSRDQ